MHLEYKDGAELAMQMRFLPEEERALAEKILNLICNEDVSINSARNALCICSDMLELTVRVTKNL